MRIRTVGNVERDNRHGGDSGVAVVKPPKAALTETEAARYIGMSAAWLKKSRTQRFRNVIDAPPFVRAGSKRVVYRQDDLDAWQERHLERVGPMRDHPPDYERELTTDDSTKTGAPRR